MKKETKDWIDIEVHFVYALAIGCVVFEKIYWLVVVFLILLSIPLQYRWAKKWQ